MLYDATSISVAALPLHSNSPVLHSVVTHRTIDSKAQSDPRLSAYASSRSCMLARTTDFFPISSSMKCHVTCTDNMNIAARAASHTSHGVANRKDAVTQRQVMTSLTSISDATSLWLSN